MKISFSSSQKNKAKNIRNSALAAGFMAASAIVGTQAHALGDGPRAYQLVPAGSQILSFGYIGQEGSSTIDPSATIRGTSGTVDVAYLQYVRTFELAGQQAAAFVFVPYGDVNGSLRLGASPIFPDAITGSSTGVGDIILGATFGLVGAPNLSLQDYVQFKPEFASGILVKLTLPTGEYDSEKLFNLGTNRASLQVAGLFSQSFGTSFLDPRLTTIEVIPAVTFYGDNSDPFRNDNLSQKPLFSLEAHLTHNVSRAVWLSADMYAINGGETETDGVANGNSKYSLGLGATVSVALSKASSIKATYGEVVDRNEAGMDGTALRVVFTQIF
ncbi:transporter [Tabrizicola sp. BL-A-41-H6]|uniref:transporter n=1 Tax=Tabrizicola sp. BL-A-41-H6 TaxID=3421107 RepID=UPI003D677773